jgi:hypothetical protein
MGVRNDVTRRKLQQTKQTATDICRAAELVNKHMKAMNATTTEAIEKLEANDCRTHQCEHRPRHRSQSRGPTTRRTYENDAREEYQCKFCNPHHKFSKSECPAYGKTCSKCHARNHFAVCCRSRIDSRNRRSDERIIQHLDDDDEDLLALDQGKRKRLRAKLIVNKEPIFLHWILEAASILSR